MNVVRYTDSDFATQMGALAAPSSLFDPVIEERTRAILKHVQDSGDRALVELTRKFDGAELTAEQLAITKAEQMTAALTADASLRAAVAMARKNIEGFSQRAKRKPWSSRNRQGGVVGEKFDPFQRVGIYVPGGTAPLASTALMTILLAKVAGCPEIVVCSPCGKDGSLNPALLYAATVAGATEIYRVGGSQAIAAMAYGTPTIKRVNKIFGPGNAYVVAAKRLLFGSVSIDLLPGPSEVLVIADDTADPRWAAADLLAQAEHGSGHERVWLITPSRKLLNAVAKEIALQLKTLQRREFIERALKANGWLIQVKDLESAVDLANQLAPEHCEVMTRKPAQLAEHIHTAGALFLGGYSPTVLGDYLAGPSHTLPTGGAGASFAGLTVDQFQRRTSVVEYTKPALKRSLSTVATFAALEGLDAHGRSASIRIDRSLKK